MSGKVKDQAQQRAYALTQELYAKGLPWLDAMQAADRQVYGPSAGDDEPRDLLTVAKHMLGFYSLDREPRSIHEASLWDEMQAAIDKAEQDQ